jgi:hypothetical protein
MVGGLMNIVTAALLLLAATGQQARDTPQIDAAQQGGRAKRERLLEIMGVVMLDLDVIIGIRFAAIGQPPARPVQCGAR